MCKVNRDVTECKWNDVEELRQYRSVGTVEECRRSVEICRAMAARGITPEIIDDYAKIEDECVKRGYTLQSLFEAKVIIESMDGRG